MINSLAQVTLKIGSPGVPDFYQGTELWDLNLVDPDNRRPVDFAHRARLLDDVDLLLDQEPPARTDTISGWLRGWKDGRIKLLVTAAGLRLRRALPDVFLGGAYMPLTTEITVPGSAVAFARMAGGEGDAPAVIFAAPRLCAGLVDRERPVPLGGDCWRTSRMMLPQSLRHRTFRHEITGAEIRPTHGGGERLDLPG